MRTPLVAGNWKMNMTVQSARSLVYAMSARLREIRGVEKVLFPPFQALQAVQALLEGGDIGVGAQNMHWEDKGAFTGEISPSMVRELCRYVIIGHSERRTYFGETNETVNRKARAAERTGLTPIICVGETLAQYEAGSTTDVVQTQILHGLQGLGEEFAPRVAIAYEPVWAIGTGKASTADNAEAVVANVVRPSLAQLFGDAPAQAIRVLYGGSVTGSNAEAYFDCDEIDGALVGGASLKPDDFVAITHAAAKV